MLNNKSVCRFTFLPTQTHQNSQQWVYSAQGSFSLLPANITPWPGAHSFLLRSQLQHLNFRLSRRSKTTNREYQREKKKYLKGSQFLTPFELKILLFYLFTQLLEPGPMTLMLSCTTNNYFKQAQAGDFYVLWMKRWKPNENRIKWKLKALSQEATMKHSYKICKFKRNYRFYKGILKLMETLLNKRLMH